MLTPGPWAYQNRYWIVNPQGVIVARVLTNDSDGAVLARAPDILATLTELAAATDAAELATEPRSLLRAHTRLFLAMDRAGAIIREFNHG